MTTTLETGTPILAMMNNGDTITGTYQGVMRDYEAPQDAPDLYDCEFILRDPDGAEWSVSGWNADLIERVDQ